MKNLLVLAGLLILFLGCTSQVMPKAPGSLIGEAVALGIAVDKSEDVVAGSKVHVKVVSDDNKIRAVYRPIYLDQYDYVNKKIIYSYGYTSDKVGNNFPMDERYADTYTFMIPEYDYSSVEGDITIPANAATGAYRIAVPAIVYNTDSGSYESWNFYIKKVSVLSLNYCPENNALKCDGSVLKKCVSNEWELDAECQYGCAQQELRCMECAPNEKLCVGQYLYTCSLNGFIPSQYDEDCGEGMCRENECKDCNAGQKKCENSQYLYTCASNGFYPAEREDCGEGKCLSNECKECKPGTKICKDAKTLKTCSNNGVYEESTCPMFCSKGACIGTPSGTPGEGNP